MSGQIIMSLLCIVAVLAAVVLVQFKLLKSKNERINELSRTLDMQKSLSKAVKEQEKKCKAEKEQLHSGTNEEKLSKTIETLKKQRKKHSEDGSKK